MMSKSLILVFGFGCSVRSVDYPEWGSFKKGVFIAYIIK